MTAVKICQPISTRHLEATTGMFTFFVQLCVQCMVCLLFILTAVASDSCRCPGCIYTIRTTSWVMHNACACHGYVTGITNHPP